MRNNLILLLFAAVAIITASCASRPSYVVSSSDFEDILYDMHRAHYLTSTKDGENEKGAKQYALMMYILSKHGVSPAEWDSSMVYYTRNADELDEIYTSLMDRMQYEAQLMGAGVSETSDTTDIWLTDKSVLLASNATNRTYQWSMQADTLLEKGEKLTLKFLALYLNENADRRATVLVTIRLANDSVITRNNIISQTSNYTLDINDDKNIGIKSISGLFMLHRQPLYAPQEQTRAETGKQVLSITNICLLHEAPQKATKEQVTENDSTSRAKPDSIKQFQESPSGTMSVPTTETNLPTRTRQITL